MLQTVLLVLHIIIAIALIAFILIQQGRGATTGAAFGSGASTTVFGARGSASFLSRTTAVLAIVFFANCMALAFLSTRTSAPTSVVERLENAAGAPVVPPAPAADEPPTTPSPAAGDMPAIPANPE